MIIVHSRKKPRPTKHCKAKMGWITARLGITKVKGMASVMWRAYQEEGEAMGYDRERLRGRTRKQGGGEWMREWRVDKRTGVRTGRKEQVRCKCVGWGWWVEPVISYLRVCVCATAPFTHNVRHTYTRWRKATGYNMWEGGREEGMEGEIRMMIKNIQKRKKR